MALFPVPKAGWLNGCIPAAVFYLSLLVLLKAFPAQTAARLSDRPGRKDDQARWGRVGPPFALAALILIAFTPLAIGKPVFWAGLGPALIGQLGFCSALISFNNTALDQPVTGGLYRYSRNPQWSAFAVILLGFGLMVGSWTVLALLSIRWGMNPLRILGQERALESQHGETYLGFKTRVPRYF